MTDELAVRHVLAHYARAHDRRDGAAMAALFTPDCRVAIAYHNQDQTQPLGELVGREAIANAVAHMMRPHPPRGWSHNSIEGLLVEINGDRAAVDAQFMVFSILGAAKPDSGWPAGAQGAQGVITPIESGYYRVTLAHADGAWLIESLQIFHNLPIAF